MNLSQLNLSAQEVSNRFTQAKVLVVGDVMLDRYWFGDTTRISPEAPVPVAKIERIEQRAGGAANVARNIASLGAPASLISVAGQDEAAQSLHTLMKEAGVQTYLAQDDSISTTIKLRVLARNQQLIRLDFEDEPSHEVLANTYNQFEQLLPQHDVVILSDYGKGGLTHVKKMIALANRFNKPVLIDPKGDNYDKYHGASLLTPNRAELKQVVGSWQTEPELTQKVMLLIEQLNLSALLLTRSEEGLSLFKKDGTIQHQGTQAREVYDVSGAGDTVIASMALGIAAQFDSSEAMKIANAAAGIVVGKLGTAICTQEELFQKLS
ncbi:D-glycero-beta-D-manno-heptose-7-phosphate kinase [Neisseria sp. Ec49-e6-T10]|uniref:D-glycero-beta-D-manno-heptose-7-phosphate kinase n=1 Tax=Neisseria sp. Ec49-e6-T10 TaxID=3140744 RepID=UPI003EB9F298